MGYRGFLAAAAAALSLGAAPAAAVAQEQGLSIELNGASDVNGNCRLVYVAVNGTGKLIDQASFDVFIFDTEGRVGQSLVFQFGRLLDGKTKVVQFDLEGTPCGSISRLLVNDIRECVAAGEETTLCIDTLKTSTRTPITFGL